VGSSALAHDGIPRLAEALPALKRGGVRFLFAGLLPVVMFYVGFRLGGSIVGILTGMAVSLTVLGVQALRIRRLDPIGLVPMILILANGTLGILTGSVELYLAAPAAEATIWGIVLVGSALMRRPLVPLIARELGVIPARFAASAGMQRSLEVLTLAWGVASFVKAGLRLWMLSWMPLEVFLIAVTLAITSVNVVMIGISVWLPLMMTRKQPHSQTA